MESDCLAVFHGRDLQADSGQDDQSAYIGPLQFLGTCHSSRVSLAPAVSLVIDTSYTRHKIVGTCRVDRVLSQPAALGSKTNTTEAGYTAGRYRL